MDPDKVEPDELLNRVKPRWRHPNEQLLARLKICCRRGADFLRQAWQSLSHRLFAHRLRSHALRITWLEPSEVARITRRLPRAVPSDEDLRHHADGTSSIAVAWVNHLPVGIGWIHWRGPRHPELLLRWPAVPEIHRLHVHKRYRSFGVGTSLIRFFEAQALSMGQLDIGLGVNLKNARALALYERLGYRRDEQLFVDEYLDTSSRQGPVLIREPSVYMVRSILVGTEE